MKRFRATSGPFEYRLTFTTGEIDEMCMEALAQAKYLPNRPEAIRIERFVEKHYTANVGYEDLGEGVLGYTAFDETGSIKGVRVSSQLEDGKASSERRVRSTWAHEAGHCLLHPSLFIVESKQNNLTFGGKPKQRLSQFLCRDNDVRPAGAQENQKVYDGRWWEWQANRAIGGFLLPKPPVREALAGLITPASQILPPSKFAEAEKLLADLFEVNPVVARIRLTEMFPDPRGQQTFAL